MHAETLLRKAQQTHLVTGAELPQRLRPFKVKATGGRTSDRHLLVFRDRDLRHILGMTNDVPIRSRLGSVTWGLARRITSELRASP